MKHFYIPRVDVDSMQTAISLTHVVSLCLSFLSLSFKFMFLHSPAKSSRLKGMHL